MANNRMNRILQNPERNLHRTHGPNGVLAGLGWRILGDLNITPTRFHMLMDQYVRDARNGIPNNKKDHTSQRGNVTKEFAKGQWTWKVFCKFMRFLQVTRIQITIKCEYETREPSWHSTSVEFGTRRDVSKFPVEEVKDDDDDEDRENEERPANLDED